MLLSTNVVPEHSESLFTNAILALDATQTNLNTPFAISDSDIVSNQPLSIPKEFLVCIIYIDRSIHAALISMPVLRLQQVWKTFSIYSIRDGALAGI